MAIVNLRVRGMKRSILPHWYLGSDIYKGNASVFSPATFNNTSTLPDTRTYTMHYVNTGGGIVDGTQTLMRSPGEQKNR